MRSFLRLLLMIGVLSLAPFSAEAQPVAKAPRFVLFETDRWRTCLAFSPDSKTLATGGEDNHIRLWDVATRKERRAILAHDAQVGVSRLAYFPDGRMLASAGWYGDGTVRLWEVATGKERLTLGKNIGGTSVLAVSPDGKYVAWGNAGKLSLYEIKTQREARSLSARGAVDSVAFSADSTSLATAHGDGRVRLWEVATGKLVREIHAGQNTATASQSVAFSRDGKILATASRQAKLWNVLTGEEIAALGPEREHPFCVTISVDGRFLACGMMSGALRLWDMATHKELHSWDEKTYSVAISPDSRWLAFGHYEGRSGVSLVDISALTK